MSKRTKGWLIAAVALILVGGVLFTGVMTMFKWDFRKLSTSEYKTNTYEVTETFTNISVETGMAQVVLVPMEDNVVSVECFDQTTIEYDVKVENDTLRISMVDHRKWYDHFALYFEMPKVTVRLPKGAYGRLKAAFTTGDITIPGDFSFDSVDLRGNTGDVYCYASVAGELKAHVTTGDIRLKNLSVGSLDLRVTTGDIAVSSVNCTGDIEAVVKTGDTLLSKVTCRNMVSKGTTGDLTLRDVVASETFTIQRNTGDVSFAACDADALTVKTTTGDITGTLLTGKRFVTHTDTGSVKVPNTDGGKCKLTTDTGDIKIAIR